MHAALFVLLADVLFIPIGVLTSAFLTRTLGPEGYGIYSLSVSVGIWVEWSILAAFSRATIKFIGERSDWRPVAATALRTNLLVSSTLGVALILAAEPIAMILNEPAIIWPVRIYGLALPLNVGSSVHGQVLTGRGLFFGRAIMSLSYSVARSLLIIGMVWLGFGIDGAIIGLGLAPLASLAVARRFARPSLRSSDFPWRELFRYAVPMLIFSISQRLLSSIDLLMLKGLGHSTAEVGFYGAAQTVALASNMAVMGITPLLLSAVTRALRDGRRERAELLVATTFRLMLLALPLIALVAGASEGVLTLVSGPRFLPAASLVPALSFAGLARGLVTAATTMLVAIGQPRIPSLLVAPLVPVAILLHACVIPLYGSAGAALVTLSVSVVAAIAGIIVIQRHWGVRASPRTLLRSVLLSALMLWLGHQVSTNGVAAAGQLALLAPLVPAGFALLGEFGRADWALLRGLAVGERSSPPPLEE